MSGGEGPKDWGSSRRDLRITPATPVLNPVLSHRKSRILRGMVLSANI